MGLIYIVDDEQMICSMLEQVFNDEGHETQVFYDSDTIEQALQKRQPDLMLLDIWLPSVDGMELLKKFRQDFQKMPIIMMSGHAGIESAVNAIKMGANDFLEKPFQLESLLEKVNSILKLPTKPSYTHASHQILQNQKNGAAILQPSTTMQRTVKNNVVLNGVGLLTGRKTGIIISPLEENQGIIFQSLDGQMIPAHVTALDSYTQTSSSFTANSTALSISGRRARTVEHLMAALYMMGVSNALIKVDEEIPNIDGSAKDFCELIQSAEVIEQSEKWNEIVINQKILVGEESLTEKHLFVEPYDGFEVQMRVDYPDPINEQCLKLNAKSDDFLKEIAPARSFNTFENIDIAQQTGKVGGGYLNSHIILHQGKALNTELRFSDEFVRHKILDLLGDLYLLGFPIRGRVYANMTSHGYNQELAKQIYQELLQ